MLSRWSILCLLGATIAVKAKQEPIHLEDAYKVLSHPSLPAHTLRLRRVPGYVCGNRTSWSGYLDVDLDKLEEIEGGLGSTKERYNHSGVVEHFYFWGFESRHEPEKNPLTLWLTGGPGCSSMTGLLQELGPCLATKDSGHGKISTKANPYSWVQKSNLIFLDQPIGVGFSYASWKNGTRTKKKSPATRVFSSQQGARDLSAFMHLLATHNDGPFGSYKNDSSVHLRDFHVAGESYAGLYIPLMVDQILTDNALYEKNPEQGLKPLPVQSMLIGNGMTSPKHLYQAYYDYACTKKSGHKPFLAKSTCREMKKHLPTCLAKVDKCNKKYNRQFCRETQFFCDEKLNDPWMGTDKSPFDYTHPDYYPEDEYIESFLNDKVTRRVLGIDDYDFGDKDDGTFVGCSDRVYWDYYSTGDGVLDSTWAVKRALEEGVRVLAYSGRRDFQCNWLGNAAWIEELQWSGHDGYAKAKMHDWYAKKGDKERAGQFRHYGGLTFATLDHAGHLVPFDDREASLVMFDRWLNPMTESGRLDSSFT